MEGLLAEVEAYDAMPQPLPATMAVKKRMLESRLEKALADIEAIEAAEDQPVNVPEVQAAAPQPIEEGSSEDILNSLDRAMAGGYELPE
jgi:hypothetical protein